MKKNRYIKVAHACTCCGMPDITGCPLVGTPGPPALGRLLRWVFGLLLPPTPLGDWSEELGVSAFPSSFNWLQYTHEHYASGLEKARPLRKALDIPPPPTTTSLLWDQIHNHTVHLTEVNNLVMATSLTRLLSQFWTLSIDLPFI
jgi:hypothetical protein